MNTDNDEDDVTMVVSMVEILIKKCWQRWRWCDDSWVDGGEESDLKNADDDGDDDCVDGEDAEKNNADDDKNDVMMVVSTVKMLEI